MIIFNNFDNFGKYLEVEWVSKCMLTTDWILLNYSHIPMQEWCGFDAITIPVGSLVLTLSVVLLTEPVYG